MTPTERAYASTQLQPVLTVEREAALARLVFGAATKAAEPAATLSKHLAFLPASSRELDLADPAQRDLGDYELLELLGQGGMGVVYRARQSSLEREVAVKLLAAGPWASRDFIERFRREAQSAARMQHPNIVPIYEIGQHEELNFFSMRLVRGPSLAQVLRRDGTPAPHAAARLLRTIAEAVDYAHRLGVLHLDLKPGNVLIDERGEPQVADFGLARRLDDSLASETDEISGTPSYMAPEQAQIKGHRLTARTDLYGLGAILYECLTGRPPFVAATPEETLRRVVTVAPEPPRSYAPNVPPDLEAITLRCLAKDPAERYVDARALADDLGRFLDGRQVSVRRLSVPERTLRWAKREPRFATAVFVAAFALLIGIVATTSQWQRAEVNAEAARRSAGAALRNSWDARRTVAFRQALDGAPFAALTPIHANLVEQAREGVTSTSDRTFLGAVWNQSPALIDMIDVGAPISSVGVSADAKTVVVTTDTGFVSAIDAATGTVRWTTDAWAGGSLLDRFLPGITRFSRDGARVLIDTRGRGHHQQFRTAYGYGNRALDVATGALAGPAPHATEIGLVAALDGPPAPAASPTHTSVLLTADGRYVARISMGRQKLRVARVADDATVQEFDASTSALFNSWAVSPDSRWLAAGRMDGSIFVVELATGRVIRPHAEPRNSVGVLSFSEDSAWLAAGTGLQSAATLYVWDVATGEPVFEPAAIGTGPEEFFGVLLHRATGVVLAALGNERVVAYRMPVDYRQIESGPSRAAQHTPFTPLGALPHATGLVATAIGASFEHSLVATGGNDGFVRLWRLLPDPAFPGAPPSAFEATRFDGRHVVLANGADVTVVDAAARTVGGGPFAHPQPVQFAQLTQDGRVLVSAASNDVFFRDWRGAAPPARARLRSTPVRLLLDEQHAQVIAGNAEIRDGSLYERLSAIGFDGVERAHAELAGPLHGAVLSRDGATLLTWRFDRIELRDSRTLEFKYAVNVETESGTGAMIVSAAFDPTDRYVMLAGLPRDAGNLRGRGFATRIAVDTPRNRVRVDLHAIASRIAPLDAQRAALQDGTTSTQTGLLVDFAARSVRITRKYGGGFMPGPGLAVDAAGARIARAGLASLLVTDGSTDAPIAPPLVFGRIRDHIDGPSRLAWSPDGTRLLATTRSQPTALVWNLSVPELGLDDLARHIAVLQGETPQRDATLPMLRAQLRARDPGAPSRTGFPPRVFERTTRPPDLPDALLDLGRDYNRGLVGYLGHAGFQNTDSGVIPQGVHTYDGTAFDVRGAIALARLESYGRPHTGPFEVPERFATLRLLMLQVEHREVGEVSLHVDFHYRDGEVRTESVTNGDDVLPLYMLPELMPATARPALPVWWGRNQSSEVTPVGPQNPQMLSLFAPRIANPHPERDVDSIVLRAGQCCVALVFAATVETAEGDSP